MKIGDLVMCMPFDFTFENRVGVILTWVRYGGTKGTVWEVLFPNGPEHWDESDLHVIHESR